MYKVAITTKMMLNINKKNDTNLQAKLDILQLSKRLKFKYTRDVVNFVTDTDDNHHALLHYGVCDGKRGLVGFSTFETLLTDDGNNTIFLNLVLLDESVRGQGLNRMSLDYMLDIKECRGINYVLVNVNGNTSVKYWMNLGFNFDKTNQLVDKKNPKAFMTLMYEHTEGYKFYTK